MNILNLKPIDNLDDRREIFHLMSKLDPESRVRFLEWCRDKTNDAIKLRHNPPWTLVVIEMSTGEVSEAYYDLMLLISQFGLKLDVVLPELEKRAANAVRLFSLN